MAAALKNFFRNIYVNVRFYMGASVCVALFIVAFFVPALMLPAKLSLFILVILFCADAVMLFSTSAGIRARRTMQTRFSNGDENDVFIQLRNRHKFEVHVKVLEELPVQFQVRNFEMNITLPAEGQERVHYIVRPTERGDYLFGDIVVLLRTRLSLAERRYALESGTTAKVYPSFANLKNLQLHAMQTQANMYGNRRVRKIGQSMEFEQIKDYINGDDIRNINWKATARKGALMVNSYVDEKAQEVYCVIDKGRLMKMPFAGLSLLDYAINSTLALNNICLQKQDKIGLITFSNKIGSIIAADGKPVQREHIMQALYKEDTAFLESDFELLYMQIRHKLKRRSLLILYTNFESLGGLNRQLPYLRSIAKYHLLLVVFFENTELSKLAAAEVSGKNDIYLKTVADKMLNEKKLVVKELQKYGITSILSKPENLTVNTINKYLELKAKQAL